jgi:PadR family transcriptional regulator PadR
VANHSETGFRRVGTRSDVFSKSANSDAIRFSSRLHQKRSRVKLLSDIDKTMKPNDLVQGTLSLLILRILALEPTHGWALSQRLKQMSKEVLQVGPGSLYPALHKLEQEGWITAEWLLSDTKRRVKFYSITRAGRKQLESQTADWKRLSGAISEIVFSAQG